jgi:3-deoxy-D-arabino-heptulosonate 7-phosphate (DAHP) synthase
MTGNPIIIAGPCSAESEDQLFETAKALKEICAVNATLDSKVSDSACCGEAGCLRVSMLRAGLWKPRTHPDSFQGVGVGGFKWLTRIHKELGMKVMIEVASAAHARAALKHGIDAVWIGARTTTNPFLVQEIASELEGSDMPVFVKNPVNPDVELWAGAVERFRAAGLSQIYAIHRGFSFFGKTKYRNIPQWQVPLDLMSRFPELPVICDPSHISGTRELVDEVAQTAMDLGLDGLFIESHISPDDALSDSQQQITPSALSSLLSSLVIRRGSFAKAAGICGKSGANEGMQAPEHIGMLRSQIDMLDDNIIELLAKRMEISAELGRYKAENDIPIFQPERWQKVLEGVSKQASELGLDPSGVREIFKIIHQMSIDKQR